MIDRPPSSPPPNRSAWPRSRSRCVRLPCSMALSTAPNSLARPAAQRHAGRHQPVARARLHQRFEHPLVDEAQVELFAQLVQRRDARRCVRATSMIAWMAPSPRPLIAVRPKRTPSGTTEKCSWLSLMSGGSTGDAALARLGDVDRELVGVLRFDRQQRRREVPRVVRLEIRGLVGEERVGRRVRLVEAVARRRTPSARRSCWPSSR